MKNIVRRFTSEKEEEVTVLDLSDLRINQICNDINEFFNLETLLMSDNCIRNFKGITKLNNLWKLDLRNNGLTYFDFPYKSFGCLRISQNNLSLSELLKLSNVHFCEIEVHSNPFVGEIESEYFPFLVRHLPHALVIDGKFVRKHDRVRGSLVKKLSPIQRGVKVIRRRKRLKEFLSCDKDLSRVRLVSINYVSQFSIERFLHEGKTTEPEKVYYNGRPLHVDAFRRLSRKKLNEALVILKGVVNFKIARNLQFELFTGLFGQTTHGELIVEDLLNLPNFCRLDIVTRLDGKDIKVEKVYSGQQEVGRALFSLIRSERVVFDLAPEIYRLVCKKRELKTGLFPEIKRERQIAQGDPVVVKKRVFRVAKLSGDICVLNNNLVVPVECLSWNKEYWVLVHGSGMRERRGGKVRRRRKKRKSDAPARVFVSGREFMLSTKAKNAHWKDLQRDVPFSIFNVKRRFVLKNPKKIFLTQGDNEGDHSDRFSNLVGLLAEKDEETKGHVLSKTTNFVKTRVSWNPVDRGNEFVVGVPFKKSVTPKNYVRPKIMKKVNSHELRLLTSKLASRRSYQHKKNEQQKSRDTRCFRSRKPFFVRRIRKKLEEEEYLRYMQEKGKRERLRPYMSFSHTM